MPQTNQFEGRLRNCRQRGRSVIGMPSANRACTLLLALTLTGAVASCTDDSLGTWKLNVQKSEHSAGHFPLRNLTISREEVEGGVRVTTWGEDDDGNPIHTTNAAHYGGSEQPVTGTGCPCDYISIKQLNTRTFISECRNREGRYRAMDRIFVPEADNTMIVVSIGTNEDGAEFSSTLVYERQTRLAQQLFQNPPCKMAYAPQRGYSEAPDRWFGRSRGLPGRFSTLQPGFCICSVTAYSTRC